MAEKDANSAMLEIMQKAQLMQDRMAAVQKEIMEKEYTTDIPLSLGSVKLTMKGDGHCHNIDIDSSDPDIDEIASAIEFALNKNMGERKADLETKMREVGKEIGLPDQAINDAVSGSIE